MASTRWSRVTLIAGKPDEHWAEVDRVHHKGWVLNTCRLGHLERWIGDLDAAKLAGVSKPARLPFWEHFSDEFPGQGTSDHSARA